MSMSLTIVTIKPVKSLIHRITLRSWTAQSPLANARGLVAPLAHQLPKSDLTGGHSPSLATTRIATCQQGGSRGSANRLGVEGSEKGALLGQLVEPWGLVGLAPVAGQISVALVIGENDDDVGLFPEEGKAQKKKGEGITRVLRHAG